MRKLSIVIVLMLTALMLSGCVMLVAETLTAAGVGGKSAPKTAPKNDGLFGDIRAEQQINSEKKVEEAAAAELGRKRTFGEVINAGDPFVESVETRLTRRTSELTGGTPVDVTPYLLHEDSFAVIEGAIAPNKSVIYIDGVYATTGTQKFSVFEFDVVATYVVNKQPEKMLLTAATCAKSAGAAKSSVSKYIWQYVAAQNDLNVADITKRKMQYTATRNGKSKFTLDTAMIGVYCTFVPVFVQGVEPGYHQFDIEVDYKKTEVSTFFGMQTSEASFDKLDKVYRVDFYSTAAAALEVQGLIWQDTSKLSKVYVSLPIINFVKVERYAK